MRSIQGLIRYKKNHQLNILVGAEFLICPKAQKVLTALNYASLTLHKQDVISTCVPSVQPLVYYYYFFKFLLKKFLFGRKIQYNLSIWGRK